MSLFEHSGKASCMLKKLNIQYICMVLTEDKGFSQWLPTEVLAIISKSLSATLIIYDKAPWLHCGVFNWQQVVSQVLWVPSLTAPPLKTEAPAAVDSASSPFAQHPLSPPPCTLKMKTPSPPPSPPPSSGSERTDYNSSNWFMGKWLLPWNVKEKEDGSFSDVTALAFQENRKGGAGIMWHCALKSNPE